MDQETKAWLFDILNAIMEIDCFLKDSPRDFISFKNDLRTRRAIERNIEIIGEAINRVIAKDPNISISNARKIVDTRNRIIQGYDSVSDEIIWGIVIYHIPVLQQEVEVLLAQKFNQVFDKVVSNTFLNLYPLRTSFSPFSALLVPSQSNNHSITPTRPMLPARYTLDPFPDLTTT